MPRVGIHAAKSTVPQSYNIYTKQYSPDPKAETVEEYLKRKGNKIKQCPTRFSMKSKQAQEPKTLEQRRAIRRYAKKVLKRET